MDILSSEINNDKTITLVKPDGETKFTNIFCGLSWPVGASHCSWCIVGEEYRTQEFFNTGKVIDRGKLILLAEKTADDLSTEQFFGPLTDALQLYSCRRVFCDTQSEQALPYVSSLQEFIYRNELPYINPERAPFEENFVWGVSQVRSWLDRGLLDLSDGPAKKQLQAISRPDLDEEPEKKFPALNALRLAIGAFCKHLPRKFKPFKRPHKKSRWG